MTAEEKLAIIRKDTEHLFCHYANLMFSGFRSTETILKKQLYEDLLDYIDKVIAEDEDYAPKSDGYMDEDVVAAARKEASGINYQRMTATEIYKRGFYDGQYWRQNNPKPYKKQ